MVAVLISISGLFYGLHFLNPSSSTSHVSSLTTNTEASLGTIPAPKGYLGADFASSGVDYALQTYNPAVSSNSNIPQSSSTGYFAFAFSNMTYSKQDIGVYLQSCSSNNPTQQSTSASSTSTQDFTSTGSGGGTYQSSCSTRTLLDFSYGPNSQGNYLVTTSTVTLPCGNQQTSSGNSGPLNYYLITFSVNTIGQPTAAPASYQYMVYGSC